MYERACKKSETTVGVVKMTPPTRAKVNKGVQGGGLALGGVLGREKSSMIE